MNYFIRFTLKLKKLTDLLFEKEIISVFILLQNVLPKLDNLQTIRLL
jgi:hypothetical protein